MWLPWKRWGPYPRYPALQMMGLKKILPFGLIFQLWRLESIARRKDINYITKDISAHKSMKLVLYCFFCFNLKMIINWSHSYLYFTWWYRIPIKRDVWLTNKSTLTNTIWSIINQIKPLLGIHHRFLIGIYWRHNQSEIIQQGYTAWIKSALGLTSSSPPPSPNHQKKQISKEITCRNQKNKYWQDQIALMSKPIYWF